MPPPLGIDSPQVIRHRPSDTNASLASLISADPEGRVMVRPNYKISSWAPGDEIGCPDHGSESAPEITAPFRKVDVTRPGHPCHHECLQSQERNWLGSAQVSSLARAGPPDPLQPGRPGGQSYRMAFPSNDSVTPRSPPDRHRSLPLRTGQTPVTDRTDPVTTHHCLQAG